MKTSPDEDRLLLSRCFSGDGEAWEIFVRRFSNLVYQAVRHTLMAKHMPFSRLDVDDLYSTIFLEFFEKGHRKLRQYRGTNGCSLSTWVRVVAVSIVLDHVRKKGLDGLSAQKTRIPIDDMPALGTRDHDDVFEHMERAEQERLLRDAIQYLPPRDRLFVKLHFEKEVPVDEVADAMQLSINNAYTIKHRIIAKIRSYLDSVLKNGAQA
jgi:RNA polymerase sigma-70 factor (ECF subfamily)